MPQSQPPSPFTSHRAAYIGAFVVLLLDQASKFAIQRTLPLYDFREVIPNFFYLRHVLNEGAAWSILSGARWPLVAISAIALVILFWFRREVLVKGPRLGSWIFALLAGGIAGNLVDRVSTGKVVDFLDFVFGTYHYPTFNVADSAICIGFFLYVLSDFLRKPAPQSSPER